MRNVQPWDSCDSFRWLNALTHYIVPRTTGGRVGKPGKVRRKFKVESEKSKVGDWRFAEPYS